MNNKYMILTSKWPQSKLALPHQFSNYRHYCCVQLVLHTLTVSIRVWQAKHIALESSNENNFNEGTLHSGVSRIKRTNTGTLELKRQREKVLPNQEGAGSS